MQDANTDKPNELEPSDALQDGMEPIDQADQNTIESETQPDQPEPESQESPEDQPAPADSEPDDSPLQPSDNEPESEPDQEMESVTESESLQSDQQEETTSESLEEPTENTEETPEEVTEPESTDENKAETSEETPEEDPASDKQPQEESTESAEEQTQPESEQPDPAQDQEETAPQPTVDTRSVIEAVLFAADEAVPVNKIADIVETCGVKEVRQHIDELNKIYEETDRVFRIEAIAGGYQMLTSSQFNPWLSKMIKVRNESKLSPAALETLAIISYKQPIIRADIEAIRGVSAGEMIRQLIEKGLVKIVGRAEEIGRPLLYGTTRKFLEVFGLNSLKDLPTADDLKKKQD